MTFRRPQPRQHSSAQWWQGLHRWQRVLVVIIVLSALSISAALIYFQPGADSPALPTLTAPPTSGTPGPEYPPGTRYYYRRSQWQQPEPPQP